MNAFGNLGRTIASVALLAIGLFIERAYCRFLCPLGAGLAILGRVRMFDWLKRRPDAFRATHTERFI